MKIISDFKDYYDSVRRTDTDKLHTYVRKTSEINLHSYMYKLEDTHHEKLNRKYHLRDSINLHMFYLGFCGEIYTGVKVGKCIAGFTSTELHYGDFKKIKQLYERMEKPFSYKPSQYNGLETYAVKRLAECFESSNINKLKKLFLKYKVPVFIVLTNFNDDEKYIHGQQIILNPELERYEFYKIKDIYTTYQDISMYIGNDLAEDRNNAWPIEDKLKVQSHGFDKYSFRKEKLKKV
jgi:hypothetical protein